jgi:hypothetical protein
MSSDNQNKSNGKHVHKSAINLDNPQKKEDSDWWAEMCKKHGEKNVWKKEDKKKS